MTLFVRGRGLEPPCLTALAPKASVSAISPPARVSDSIIKMNYKQILANKNSKKTLLYIGILNISFP